MTDVIVNKVESIQRCVKRACEQSIDLANHIIRNRKLGIPKDTAQTFDLLSFTDQVLAGEAEEV